MSQDNPIFTPRHPYQQPMHSPPSSGGGGQRVLLVLGIVAAVGLAMCCGMGTLAYVAIQRASNGQVAVELPPRRGGFAEDAARFNRSLAALQQDPCDDSGVCEFVRRGVAAGNQNETIPFSRSMFIEAIANSEYSKGRFSITDRLSVTSWLAGGDPEPDTEEFYRILAIHRDANPDLATVDLLFYTPDSQCESHQWYLVREAGNWKIYDWQRMEYGRRMSDEYAGYVQGVSPVAEGYDEVMAKLVDTQKLWEDGETEAAEASLRACEATAMLAGDLPVAQLRIAYVWLAWNENEQAIRVLESIETPDQRWGVWPVLAMAYMNKGDYQKALEIAGQAQQQSPQHPNLYWLLSEIYDGLERPEEAADAAVQAFVICSDDVTLLQNVVYYDRPQDIPVLLEVLTETQVEQGWSRILNQASFSTDWGTALVEQLALSENVPLGAADIAAGNLAWSKQDYDTAAKHFAVAKRVAEQPFLQEMASRDYLYARMEEDRFAELFAESDDLDATLKELVQLAYDDEFYGDETKLLDAIQQQETLSENIWATALRGWIYFITEQPEPALPEFIRFADWLQANESTLEEDDQWLSSTADYYISESLLALKRPLDVLQRWPDDVERHDQLGSQLLRLRERSTINDFLQATEGSTVDSVRLQRLRLMAELAFRDGQPERCDGLHQQAIDLARDVYEDSQAYQLDALLWQRVRDVVWTSGVAERLSAVAALLDTADAEQRQQLVIQAANRARDIYDRKVFDVCLQQAVAAGITEGALWAELKDSQGQLDMWEGRYPQAIDAFQASLDHTPEEERWTFDQRRENRLLALLRGGQFEEAQDFATAHPSEYEGTIATAAVVDLARGDASSLRSHFKADDKPSKQAFGDWLSSSMHREWLVAFAEEAWFEQLLADVPLTIRTQQTQASGTVLLDAGTSLDASLVKQWLQTASERSFQLTQIALDDTSDDSQAWLAVSEVGQRLVVHSYKATCDSQGLQIENAIALLDSVRAVTITVLDSRPHAVRRLFAVASTVAAEAPAIGFWYESEFWLWTSPDLAQQLQWSGRVPVGPSVAAAPIFSIEQERSSDSQEYVGIDQWASRLKSADGPLSVILTLACGSVNEAVPSVIEKVDVENSDLLIRPTVNSQLFPWIKQGLPYRCAAGFVHEAASSNP